MGCVPKWKRVNINSGGYIGTVRRILSNQLGRTSMKIVIQIVTAKDFCERYFPE